MKVRLVIAVIAFGAALASSPLPASVIYVDANAIGTTHDGSNWCSAFRHLQDALAVASPSDTVRVARGTYKPDQGVQKIAGDRSATFPMESSVSLEGGFAGCAANDPDSRDVWLFESVLSGDLAGDDASAGGSALENSYHVVSAIDVGPSGQLDGFTIVAGNASGADLDARGGGLLSVNAGPTIRNCVFRGNRGVFGGAVNIEGGYPTVVNSSFFGNAAEFSGGAIRGWQCYPDFVNCLLVDNSAETGGAAWFGASAPIFRNCSLVDNAAPLGNALSFDSCCPQQPSYLEASDCIFWNGGEEIAIIDGSVVSLTHSIMEGGYPGLNNSALDPLFVPGPMGCHYLSQEAAGQSHHSPAVNAGSASASGLGFAQRTTRSDEGEDSGLVDIGHHFPITHRALVMGDDDRNLRLDLLDFASLQRCFSGTGFGDVTPCCRIFNFEQDANINVVDLRSFALIMTGP